MNNNCEELKEENLKCLKDGLCNLEVHINNMKQYSNHVIVCLNMFNLKFGRRLNYHQSLPRISSRLLYRHLPSDGL